MEVIPNNIEPTGAVKALAIGPWLVEPNEPRYEGDGLDFTDVDNADRLIRRHGHKLRYCAQWKCWLTWDGQRWTKDETGQIIEVVKETARQIQVTAGKINNLDKAKDWFRFAIKSQSRDRLNAMASLAQSDERVVVRSDDFDRDVELLNCLSGVIDLRTGQVRPHKREQLITKLAPTHYDPKLKPVRWLEFLNVAMGGNERMIAYLQRCVGYTLTGRTDEAAIFIPYGSGNNGKSVFTWTLDQILGDCACSAEPETLMTKRRDGSGPSGDVARLKGARLVRAAESEMGQRLNESLLQRMTGGERVVARYAYGNDFEFTPEFKIWMPTNHKPTVRGTDKGIWRRLKLVPFEVDIPASLPSERRKSRDQVQAELAAELPGILAWAVEGSRLWHQSGLQEPPEVTNATSEYQQEMDALANFIAECCIVRDGLRTRKQALYAAYRRWCDDNNGTPLNDRNFGVRLGEKGFAKGPDGAGYTCYRRIGLAVEPALRDNASDSRQQAFADGDIPIN
jgi:putative DNA primase/helicase